MAPFDILYGRGQSLIITNNFRPSCFRTSDKASNLRSLATMPLTYLESNVRDTIKEHVDPIIVADATIGQLIGCQLSFKVSLHLYSKQWIARIAHPPGKPYIKPASVRHVEYPMTGGKAVAKHMSHSINHPPFKFFHFSATGFNHAKIFSLKMRKSMAITIVRIPAINDRSF